LDVKEVITAAIAGAGLALSVFNTVQASMRNRVRFKVLPKSAVRVAQNAFERSLAVYPPGAMFCIDVVNLSAFPITVDAVGFTRTGTKLRVACPLPVLLDDEGWPRRIEPHNSVTAYIDIGELPRDISKAYATTQSGVTRYGTSAALRDLRKALNKKAHEQSAR
jgi:hypothetical protein